ncbi:ParB/RepB/Spo0J family partition protein [Streptomyces griseofuscus]|uniref:ParB/RepB/Spo0J family partition protein n=1 Tax=Streptomyces griseofuscus TaxID=146922 RepID=UPI0033E34007
MIEVSVDDIDPNPYNDREMVGLEELAESIAEDGLLSPITVIRREAFTTAHPEDAEGLTKTWVLGPGEHRWRATKMAGQATIRGIVRDDLAKKIRGILLLENVYRTDPSPMEKARQIQAAMDKDGLSIREAAKILKMGPTSVHKLTELLKLPADASEAVHRGALVPTHARKLLTLPDSESVSTAFQLMVQRELKVDEAIRLVLAEGTSALPAGESEAAGGQPEEAPVVSEAEDPSAEGALPRQTRTDHPGDTLPDQDEGEAEEAGADDQEGEGKDAEQQQAAPAAAPARTALRSPKATATQDPNAAERDAASADREAACWSLLQRDEYATDEQVAATMARALLVPSQLRQEAARAKAHAWLRKANRAQFDVSNADAYHQAVLSSRDSALIARVTFATALAASEIRAADRRRRTWDQHDAAHVQLLIEAVNYVPETDWEVRELTRHNVQVPEKQPTELN